MTRNSIILSLYIAIFICIAMALWNPKLSLKKADAQLTVLVDNSNSVGAAAWQDFQKNIRPVLETQYDEVNALFFSNTVAGQAEANT
ncbi:MAG TPA: hypothetical protein ENJ28_09085, partial [Gammaproteobacteria bacterium]|nr:hypothetical protein [Gammaproteobacteria bacterium]